MAGKKCCHLWERYYYTALKNVRCLQKRTQPLLINVVIITDILLSNQCEHIFVSSLRLLLNPTPTAGFGAIRICHFVQHLNHDILSKMVFQQTGIQQTQSWTKCRIEVFTAYEDPPSCSLALVTSHVSTTHTVDILQTDYTHLFDITELLPEDSDACGR